MQIVKTKSVKTDRRQLKVTAPIVVNGDIQAAGKVIEVSESEARGLIGRGKAVDAIAAEVAAAGAALVIATHRENNWSDVL